jgi:hypothetical protein
MRSSIMTKGGVDKGSQHRQVGNIWVRWQWRFVAEINYQVYIKI